MNFWSVMNTKQNFKRISVKISEGTLGGNPDEIPRAKIEVVVGRIPQDFLGGFAEGFYGEIPEGTS